MTNTLMLPLLLLAAGAAVFLPSPADARARLLQHLLGVTLQVLAAGSAAVLLGQAARGYGRGERERRVWFLSAAAAAAWTIGFLIYAVRKWAGAPRTYPSTADGFLVAASLILAAALADEFWLIRPMLTRHQRVALIIAGLSLLIVVVGRFMWPIIVAPLAGTEKGLGLFYAGSVALLFPLALGPAVAFRGGASGYVWMGIAAGVLALAAANLGFVYLNTYDLYSDAHPINLLRVAGLAGLGASAAWQRRTVEAL
ncbi:MAG TPA: hypothetical protein VGR25_08115 [bacterium]|jgi:hypothetical protein|nr:hypothetical protein [bacterium]